MYERHSHRLLAWPAFLRRAFKHVLWGVVIILAGTGIGTLGYHQLASLHWIDAFLNASMILSGMGPVDRLETTAAKLFASVYALFSGLVFIGVAGVLAAPWVHRVFHWMHIDASKS
jgi:hypothetical protein